MIMSAFYLKSLLSSLITKIITSLQKTPHKYLQNIKHQEKNKTNQNKFVLRTAKVLVVLARRRHKILFSYWNKNNILKKENNNLKSKLNLLCPTCKLLFSNDKIFKSHVTTSNTSTTTTNTNTMKNKFIIKSSSIFEFKDKENPAHKKIGAVVGINLLSMSYIEYILQFCKC